MSWLLILLGLFFWGRREDWRGHSAPRWERGSWPSLCEILRALCFHAVVLAIFVSWKKLRRILPNSHGTALGTGLFFAPRCLPNQLPECTPIFSPLFFFLTDIQLVTCVEYHKFRVPTWCFIVGDVNRGLRFVLVTLENLSPPAILACRGEKGKFLSCLSSCLLVFRAQGS